MGYQQGGRGGLASRFQAAGGRARLRELASWRFGHDESSTYWRRRVIVLVVGLVILGLAAWGLSNAFAVSSARAKTGTGRTLQSSRQTAGPAGQAGQPGTTGTTRAAGAAASRPGGPSAGQATGNGKILPAFCARADIVISIFTGQSQFGRRQWPQFDLNVVSTQKAECSFNLGSAHIELVIREGPARIWSSGDCAAGKTGLITALRRGVPTVLAITWDRRTSAPGCSGRAIGVPAGIYTAYAVDGDLTSAPVTFRLS